ncbi:hypothetical protein [Pseudomonas sp. JDS28PS106]
MTVRVRPWPHDRLRWTAAMPRASLLLR